MTPSNMESRSLRASYNSPSESRNFGTQISTETSIEPDSKFKTAYLSELRSSTKQLQNDINVFLTQKMEEDKKIVGDEDKRKTKDELEEENYGEEPAEED